MSNANRRILWDNGILPSFVLQRSNSRCCGPQVVRGRHGGSCALYVVAKNMFLLPCSARRSKVLFQAVHGSSVDLGGLGVDLQCVLIQISFVLPWSSRLTSCWSRLLLFGRIGHGSVAEILRVIWLFNLFAFPSRLAEDDLSFNSHKCLARRAAGIAIVLKVIAINTVVPSDGFLQRTKTKCINYTAWSVYSRLAEAGIDKTYMADLVQIEHNRSCKTESRVYWSHLGHKQPSPVESTLANSCNNSTQKSRIRIQNSSRPRHHLCPIPTGFVSLVDEHCRPLGQI